MVACGRVSTEDQALGKDLQTTKFTAYAVAHELELVKVFSDELSGKSMERPGLLEALRMLEAGQADGLLVTKLDRLTRSTADFEVLLERYFKPGRYELLTVDDAVDTRTAMGRFVLRLHVALGQLERERLAERTKESLEHLRKTGGGTPRIEGVAIARMLELEERGMTLREIAEALTEEGVPTLKGGRWAAETVRRVLARAHGEGARA